MNEKKVLEENNRLKKTIEEYEKRLKALNTWAGEIFRSHTDDTWVMSSFVVNCKCLKTKDLFDLHFLTIEQVNNFCEEVKEDDPDTEVLNYERIIIDLPSDYNHFLESKKI